jgi:DNA-binding transcriptional LysR family regulator
MEVFRTVVETGSTVKAAQLLYSSQSSVSKTLTRLEENVGCPLFLRQRGRIALTRAGESFADSVNRILDDLDSSVSEAQRIHASLDTLFHIAGSSYLLRDLVRSYCDDAPDIHFNLQLYPERYLSSLLSNREVDLILSTLPGNYQNASLNWAPLMECEILVVIPEGHPLAKKPHITLADIQGEHFICNNIGINGDFLRHAFKNNGLHLEHLLECNDNTVFEDYLDHSDRLTFIPSYATGLGERRGGRVERRIEGRQLFQRYGLAYPRNGSMPTALQDFVHHSASFCSTLSAQADHFVQHMGDA